MAGNSAWNQAVKNAFKMGRKMNKNYSLKDAMMDAKKVYKKGEGAVMGMSMGKQSRHRRSSKNKHNRRRTSRGGSPLQPTELGK